MNAKKRRLILLAITLVALGAVAASIIFFAGGGNGYEVCAKALEKLMYETDSLQYNYELAATLDGEETSAETGEYKFNRGEQSERIESREAGEPARVKYTYIMGDTRYRFVDHEARTYSSYSVGRDKSETLIEDTELNRQYFKLYKLLADFVSGSAKNHIIKQGSRDGETTYSLSLTEAQLPELARTGLNISNMVIAREDTWLKVEYEDERKAFLKYYQDKAGEPLDEIVFSVRGDNKELNTAYYQMRDEMRDSYNALAGENRRVYVTKEGEALIYDTWREYVKHHPSEGRLLFGVNAERLDFVKLNCSARVDDVGRFTYLDAEIYVTLTDYYGAVYELTLEYTCDISNYGQTLPDTFDVDAYTKTITEYVEPTYETVERDVTFNGVTYHVESREAVK